MRDPARIDRILEKLRTYWHAAPDLRLAQIVCNFTPPVKAPDGNHFVPTDPYHVEDDVIERALDAQTPRARAKGRNVNATSTGRQR